MIDYRHEKPEWPKAQMLQSCIPGLYQHCVNVTYGKGQMMEPGRLQVLLRWWVARLHLPNHFRATCESQKLWDRGYLVHQGSILETVHPHQ